MVASPAEVVARSPDITAVALASASRSKRSPGSLTATPSPVGVPSTGPGPLLHDVGQLVGERVPAVVAVGLVGAAG